MSEFKGEMPATFHREGEAPRIRTRSRPRPTAARIGRGGRPPHLDFFVFLLSLDSPFTPPPPSTSSFLGFFRSAAAAAAAGSLAA
ncbi:Hypothetical protein NTJ_00002 [Nesidiocoris tenuis]|uniref:Uncharacterized protein n=1 Tax=Nesidiocoris tenuis TaxID=355587 RepID=A0ABN7A7H3_9HEMI|nr:Hypothetical protein NTJ_00002 [Nesidiocoris tenuis]